MEMTVTHHYEYSLGPIEQVSVEVLKDRYGRITTRRWRNQRQYAIELATLAPEPKQIIHIAWSWLIAGIVSLAGLAGFIAFLKYGNSHLPILEAAGGIIGLLVLTVLFFYLFTILSTRRIVFHARFSGTPLIEIPIPMQHRRKGKLLAEELSKLAQKNRARLHHSDDDMRAGELRMLRRLSEEGAIDSNAYDQAKVLLLRLAT
jgi:hypothetical protein